MQGHYARSMQGQGKIDARPMQVQCKITTTEVQDHYHTENVEDRQKSH